MSQSRNKFLQVRVSPDEKSAIEAKSAAEFGGTSFSNMVRILLGLEPLDRPGAPKGNQNKLGKPGANRSSKK